MKAQFLIAQQPYNFNAAKTFPFIYSFLKTIFMTHLCMLMYALYQKNIYVFFFQGDLEREIRQ